MATGSSTPRRRGCSTVARWCSSRLPSTTSSSRPRWPTDADLIVTDSNRRRIQTWFYALRDTRGHTERAGETAADPTGYDFRLNPFDDVDDDDRTVVEQVGGTVEVTSDGGPDRPEDRGAHAVDGDPSTAWRVGGGDPSGQRITLVPDSPPIVDQVLLLQPASARTGRAVSTVNITVNDGEAFEVVLGPDSLSSPGQVVEIPEQAVARLDVEITSVAGGTEEDPVGLAEIGVGSTQVAEVVRLPVDLLDRVGEQLTDHGLDIVLTRLRLDLPDTDRLDDEAHLDRRFELPVARTFHLQGTVRGAEGPAGAPASACRDDLVAIDGDPLPVRIQPTDAGGNASELTSCAPVPLGAGSHRVTAAAGAETGWDVDQLVLSSGRDGEPADVAPRGAPVGARTPRHRNERVRVLRRGRDRLGRDPVLVRAGAERR